MEPIRIDFSRLPWEEPTPGMRCRTAIRGTAQLRLVRIDPSFREPHPEGCASAHIGYVLHGTLEINQAGRTETLRAGDGLWIEAGADDRHRATAIGGPVELVLFETGSTPGQSR